MDSFKNRTTLDGAGKGSEAVVSDDELFKTSAFQFAADRLGKLVRIAERDPKRQVLVDKETIERLYFAYLGALDIAKEHTQAAININGKVHLCSRTLQQEVVPLVAENIRRAGEAEVLRDLAGIREAKAAAQKANSGNSSTSVRPPPLRTLA